MVNHTPDGDWALPATVGTAHSGIAMTREGISQPVVVAVRDLIGRT